MYAECRIPLMHSAVLMNFLDLDLVCKLFSFLVLHQICKSWGLGGTGRGWGIKIFELFGGGFFKSNINWCCMWVAVRIDGFLVVLAWLNRSNSQQWQNNSHQPTLTANNPCHHSQLTLLFHNWISLCGKIFSQTLLFWFLFFPSNTSSHPFFYSILLWFLPSYLFSSCFTSSWLCAIALCSCFFLLLLLLYILSLFSWACWNLHRDKL